MDKKKLIILTGPTAAGKTDLSILLAKAVDGEIISADSMQIYQDMTIGTAKILPEEMQGVRHHLVDELRPDEAFNIVEFQKMSKRAMDEIYQRGHIPIIVGGTGFYIQAILNDICFDEETGDKSYRASLEAMAEEGKGDLLVQMLKEADPKSLEKIHPNNIKRVIRALEYYHETGMPISEHNEKEAAKSSPYHFAYFVVTRPREVLYKRIEKRIDLMLEAGLLNEVENLLKKGYTKDLVSMQGLGYKEIIGYLEGDMSLEEAVYILKRDTRHFAKRQITWFKREPEAIWFDLEAFAGPEAVLNEMLQILQSKHIIDTTLRYDNAADT